MSLGVGLLLLVALFFLIPGAYLIARPRLPGWVRPWMIWPLRGTGPRVLRLQGWAGACVGVAWLFLAVAALASLWALIVLSIPFLVLGVIVWVVSVTMSIRGDPLAAPS